MLTSLADKVFFYTLIPLEGPLMERSIIHTVTQTASHIKLLHKSETTMYKLLSCFLLKSLTKSFSQHAADHIRLQ